MSKKTILLLGLLITSLAGGIAWYSYQSRHSEAALIARAHEYWEAVKIHDLVTAYQMEAETARGTLFPHEVELRHDWGVRVVGYQLGKVDYFDDYAEIEMSMEITLPDSTKTQTKKGKKDVWTFMKGYWYHGVPGDSVMRRRHRPQATAAPWNPFSSD